MQLYTFDPAPNPQRLKLFLQVKSIELPTQQVSLNDGQQMSADYIAVNPARTVPALVLDDGTVLTETIAIVAYLDALFPNQPLLGDDPASKALILNWCHRCFNEGFHAVAEALRNRGDFFKDRALPGSGDFAQIPALVERGIARLHLFWGVLDDHLGGRHYMVGDVLSQADIDCFVLCNFAGWIKQAIPDDTPALKAWHQRIAEQLGQ